MSELDPAADRRANKATPAARRALRRVVLATVLGALVFAGLSIYGDVRALLGQMAQFQWRWFVAAVGLTSASYAVRFARWQLYLHVLNVHVPQAESLLVFLSGFIMSVTPAKLGEVFKSYLLWEARLVAPARTAPIIVAERLTDLAALVLLGAWGAVQFPEGRAAAVAGALIVVAVLVVIMVPRWGKGLVAISGRLPFLRKRTATLSQLYETLQTVLQPLTLFGSVSLAVASWGLECLSLVWVARGFGAELAFGAAAVCYASSTIAGALAMVPGGLGVTEASLTGLLQVLAPRVSTTVATGTTVLIRVATLWWAVLVGAVALGILRERMRRHPPTTTELPGTSDSATS